jgi:hypothetical protein
MENPGSERRFDRLFPAIPGYGIWLALPELLTFD